MIKSVIGSIEQQGLRIAPWIQQNFWFNCQSDEFRDEFLQRLLKFLIQQSKSGTKDLSKTINTIVYILISYGYEARDSQEIRSLISEVLEMGDQRLNHFGILADNIIGSNCYNFRVFVSRIILPPDSKELQPFVQISSFFWLIRILCTYEGSRPLFYQSLITNLKSTMPLPSMICLVHLIRVILVFISDIESDVLETILPLVRDLNNGISPLAELCFDLVRTMKKQIKFPGIALLMALQDISSSNSPYGAAVPLIYTGSCKDITNSLYCPTSPMYSLPLVYSKFFKYYTKAVFRSNKKLPIDKVVKAVSMLAPTMATHLKVAKKFGLKTEIPDDKHLSSKGVYPPYLQLKPVKVSLTFEFTTALVQPIFQGISIFTSPSLAIIKNQIIDGLLNSSAPFIKQKVVLIGTDFLISNVLSAIGAYPIPNGQIVLYYIPTESSELTDFISSRDPIYCFMAKNMVDIVSELLPESDEESTLTFPAVEPSERRDQHPWLTNPSPNSIFNSALQHFMLFANEYIDIYVWMCTLTIDSIEASVPFFTSVHIGNDFTAGGTQPINKMMSLSYNDCTESTVVLNQKISSVSIWNVNLALNVEPTDSNLLLQFCGKQLTKKNIDQELKQTMTTDITVSGSKFDVVVEKRIFKNVTSVHVHRMDDPKNFERQQMLRFATFSRI